MRINKLRLKNFRCFENLEMNLNPNCNILTGINGAGKSTILDALAVALGAYLSGYDGINSSSILAEDAHCRMISAGNRIEPQEQFPVEVYVEATVKEEDEGVGACERVISWQRELNGKRTL